MEPDAIRAACIARVRDLQARTVAQQKAKREALRLAKPPKLPRLKVPKAARYYWYHKYGLTRETHTAMRRRQQFSCFICNRHETEIGETLHVDHHHESGKVRSLLCRGCNTAIGAARENPHVLRMCATYIELFEKVRQQDRST